MNNFTKENKVIISRYKFEKNSGEPDKVRPDSTPAKVRNHALADSTFHGKGSKWAIATVINGPFKGEDVCIWVEFLDGYCVCEFSVDNNGNAAPREIIHINDLRTWISVDSVNT